MDKILKRMNKLFEDLLETFHEVFEALCACFRGFCASLAAEQEEPAALVCEAPLTGWNDNPFEDSPLPGAICRRVLFEQDG